MTGTRGVVLGLALVLLLGACAGAENAEVEQDDVSQGEQEPAPETVQPEVEADPDAAEAGTATAAEQPADAMEAHAAGADPFEALKAAADHVGPGGSAKALAGGIAEAADLRGNLESPAGELYTNLSALLQEHVYLAGIAVSTGLSQGLDSDAFMAAAATLDTNSVALADLVGSVAPDKRDAFLELWRQHIGFFVQYAKGNEKQALRNLDQYRQQAGAFFEEVTGGALPASAVAKELEGHVKTVTQAIDAAQKGKPSVYRQLKQASDHVDAGGAALALSQGIAQAAGLEGSIDAPAVQTYAQLATLLEEHVYLAGMAVDAGYAHGLDSKAFRSAAATLDRNSVALADLVGSVAGPEKRDAFLELWRRHIGFFVDYAKAAAAGDEQAKAQALENLDEYRQQAGAFFEDVTAGALPADAVADSLQEHVQTLTAAIDALAAAHTS